MKLTPVAYGCDVTEITIPIEAVNTHRNKPAVSQLNITNTASSFSPSAKKFIAPPHNLIQLLLKQLTAIKPALFVTPEGRT